MFRTGGDCLLISHSSECCADILYWSAQIWWSVLWSQRFAFVPSGVNLLTKVCTLKTQISSCFSNYNISFLFTQQIYTLHLICDYYRNNSVKYSDDIYSYACGSYGNFFYRIKKFKKSFVTSHYSLFITHNSDFDPIPNPQFWEKLNCEDINP